MKNLQEVVKSAKQLLTSAQDVDCVIEYLCAHGCSKAESIFVIARIVPLPLPEAELLVHESKAWRSRKQDDESFQEIFFRYLSDMSKDESEGEFS